MRRTTVGIIVAGVMAVLGIGFSAANTFAEDNAESGSDNAAPATSMTLKPVSTTLSLSSNSTYDGTMTVSNDGDTDMKIQVYATPYFYVYSQDDDTYKLGFNTENSYTQITRWITIKDTSGNYVEKPTFTIKPKESIDIKYKVTTPKSIPAGGQYAVIFAQTISGNVNASGVRTEASTGMLIYGRSTEGETKAEAEFSSMEIGQGNKLKSSAGNNQTDADDANNSSRDNNFYGFAKVKNTGNIDFFTKGTLKVEPIIGFSSYETDSKGGVVSVIPESERIIEDHWDETPGFGLYKVTWTVEADMNGEKKVESIERVILLLSPLSIIISIIVLTFIIVLAIILIRKRKARRSRLAV